MELRRGRIRIQIRPITDFKREYAVSKDTGAGLAGKQKPREASPARLQLRSRTLDAPYPPPPAYLKAVKLDAAVKGNPLTIVE